MNIRIDSDQLRVRISLLELQKLEVSGQIKQSFTYLPFDIMLQQVNVSQVGYLKNNSLYLYITSDEMLQLSNNDFKKNGILLIVDCNDENIGVDLQVDLYNS